ncbi:dihydroneopterin aldolase [Oikeobacillus pervagus]|uniref:7,8-dihydroneopterin aldolase n=1 Tax=Oikeobacillus pervagus TaxID=1325931 RepID=A0AAJ1T5E6_9BACI|nr:dihydroneopterin aldolase [Oikeobacillus pervagus]MDQ0216174.1 dihydroneopterin aldolase [Oikeobacillus pervagus]
MDKIFLEGLDFYGYHGVFPEENKLGQRFRVDLTLHAPLKKAGKSDDLKNSVNYADVYEIAKTMVEKKQFKLIEAVAEHISSEILATFSSVESCTVKVTKPNPPIAGCYQSVAVEITRGR